MPLQNSRMISQSAKDTVCSEDFMVSIYYCLLSLWNRGIFKNNMDDKSFHQDIWFSRKHVLSHCTRGFILHPVGNTSKILLWRNHQLIPCAKFYSSVETASFLAPSSLYSLYWPRGGFWDGHSTQLAPMRCEQRYTAFLEGKRFLTYFPYEVGRL